MLAYTVAVAGGRLSEAHHALVEQIVDAVARRWHEPDHGIWEVRRPPRHHVHSQRDVLARGRPRPAARPPQPAGPSRRAGRRSPIASPQTSSTTAGSPRCGAFTAAYDGLDLDAAALQVGLSGLLPADDERFAATVEAVEPRCARVRPSTATAATTGCPAARAGSISARSGWPRRMRSSAARATRRRSSSRCWSWRARPGCSRSSTTRGRSAPSAITPRRTRTSG